MTSRAVLFAVVAACCSLACSQPSETTPADAPAPGSTASTADVNSLVETHLGALESGNVALLDSLTAPDAVHVFANGERATEQQMLDKAKAMSHPAYEIVKAATRVFGDAVVVDAVVKEKASGRLFHLTQVWVKPEGAMNTTAHRETAPALAGVLMTPGTRVAQAAMRSSFKLVAMHASTTSATDPFTNECCVSMMSDPMSAGEAPDPAAADPAAAGAAAAGRTNRKPDQ